MTDPPFTDCCRVADIPSAVTGHHEVAVPLRVRRPVVILDFDGALIDPATSDLIDGVAEPLARLAATCTVAVIGHRDPADLRTRVGLPSLWYIGSDGSDLVGPDGRRFTNQIAVQHTPETVPAADMGRSVRWLLNHVDESHELLPIVVGDDRTGEDAFAAVARGGESVVVRGAGSHARRSAARFAVDGPDGVRELLVRLADTVDRNPIGPVRDGGWILGFDGYDPGTERLREALCTVGNGYFASRGCAPECTAGPGHYPGTYVAGLYNRLHEERDGVPIANESLVNAPNWLTTTFRIDGGPWFDVDAAALLDFRQELNLRHGVLTRRLRFRDDSGRTTAVVQRRFVAMNEPHVCALETSLVAENWTGSVEFRSAIDGSVRNTLVKRYRDLASDHLDGVSVAEPTSDSVLLSVQTNQSRIPIAVAARTVVRRGQIPDDCRRSYFDTAGVVGHDIRFDVARGHSVSVEKTVVVFTGRDRAMSDPVDEAVRRLPGLAGFNGLLAGHALAWEQLWDRVGIHLADHREASRILRFHLLHLLQTVSPLATVDLDVGVPARGLHGEAYRGHVFWDELFVLPVLNLRVPALTRSLLAYRYRRLPEARRAARIAGHDGAMFPWQSGSDGREESQQVHLNPLSGRWLPDVSWRQHHIGVAVAYNVWQYYQVTGDVGFLADQGAELLVEIARFFSSLASYDDDRSRFVITGVVGPDEFHTGYPSAPLGGVDNNAYTNVMAVWVILRALDALEALPARIRTELVDRLDVRTPETARWREIGRRMFVPFHDGMISQFEGYAALIELDWDEYRRRHRDIRRLDRILDAEGDDVNRYRASKQADVLMLYYLLSADELRDLLGRLGYRLEPNSIPRTIDYYIARTSEGSTLSAVVHSWVLARANRDRALEYFDKVLASDITDIQGGTTAEGVHLAAMAGSVDLLQRCFTGLETRGDKLVFGPHWPEHLGALEFPVSYRGHDLWLAVNGREIRVSAAAGDQLPIDVVCRGHTERVLPGGTVTLS